MDLYGACVLNSLDIETSMLSRNQSRPGHSVLLGGRSHVDVPRKTLNDHTVSGQIMPLKPDMNADVLIHDCIAALTE